MRYATAEPYNFLYAAIADGGPGHVLADTLFQTAAAFGFSAATLLQMPSRTDHALMGLVLESSLPDAFWERMDNCCPLSTCALFNAARSSILPLQWSVENMVQQHSLLDMVEPPVVALYREYRISRGIVIPVSSFDGVRHAVRFDGDRPPLTQAEINDLSMLALHFLQAYDRDRCPLAADLGGLSERELEIVRWTATGKTSSEIALIMALSDHTINAYMNNALKKTNCVNRTQLVAKALRMRIIS
jgi:DNA-binding CsgD family transcriptional regulator